MNRPEFLNRLIEENLVWMPEIGIGYYPVTDQPYDEAYWQKYLDMDQTPTGLALTEKRIKFVRSFYFGQELVDIGIGGGRFCQQFGGYGFDVNPEAIRWLKTTNTWLDPYEEQIEVATFWDSLEHIHNPTGLLANVTKWAFVSAPIYRDAEHILESKHFRKDEHCWYWTAPGLCRFMKHHGFSLIEANTMESEWREDIGTFVFKRL